jgi:hypothetical protein
LLGYSSANLSSSSAAGQNAAMYGGFYVLYDEASENLADSSAKDDDDGVSRMGYLLSFSPSLCLLLFINLFLK